ncbi:3-oxoacyl-[acyl-carrier-protein] reductase FabG [bioreactor metagenome]|uniref:Peroxisomal trans-2-enoyl-CoA reductase n=1 Tax=bioreactor metagenome TaxID=1076179 RepID=A0A645G7P2_9ZZZZ
MTAKMPEKAIDRMLSTIPMRRGGTVDEVASVICFLASDDASFINGQTIAINGGSYNA